MSVPKIIFDIQLISETLVKGDQGTGIFYVAYNVFKNLLKNDKIQIILYDNSLTKDKLNLIKRHFNIEGLKTVECLSINKIISLLQKYKKNSYKKNASNFFAKAIRGIIKIVLLPILNATRNVLKTISVSFAHIYLSPIYKIPEQIEKRKGIKKYVILYDTVPLVLPETNPVSNEKSWYMQLIKQINKKDNYFAISEYTKQEFIKYVPAIDIEKITVTLLAAGDNFIPNTNYKKNIMVRSKYNIPQNKNYFLSLCTIEPRKNLVFAVKNFLTFIKINKINDLVLVLVGRKWKSISETILNEISEIDINNIIIQTGYADYEDLSILYSNAECFVYPSLYEGFGLPPLEAMKCGTPVITSNTSSLPEVVGDAGIMVDPYTDDALINAYEQIYFDENLRKELSRKGIERAKKFSWKKCTDIMVNQFYKDLK